MMRRIPIASDGNIRPSDSIAVADRNRLIETHVDLASWLPRRFKGRGEELDDLRQVALLALAQAAERFDPSYGFAFTTFATPTIVGALKRHLRDHTWAIRPPCSSQEREQSSAVAFVAIGAALVSAFLISGSVGGAGVNPAGVLARILVAGIFTDWWVYVVAPLVGGVGAALL